MTDRFYGWHPCPSCDGTGFSNTLNTEMHISPVEYPSSGIEFCQSCGVDLCAFFPTPEGLPIVMIGPPYTANQEDIIAWEADATVRVFRLERTVRQGLDVYAVAAADPAYIIAKPSLPDHVPTCMAGNE